MNRRWVTVITIALLTVGTLAGCGGGQPAPPPAPAPTAPNEPPPPPPPMIASVVDTELSLCVVKDGRIAIVDTQYNPATGDTTVNGRSFSEVYPPIAEYAAAHPWYANHEPVTFNGRRYVQYGLPLVLGRDEVAPAGTSGGVTVFVEAGAASPPEVIYLPVNPRCEFQPYHGPESGGGVRG